MSRYVRPHTMMTQISVRLAYIVLAFLMMEERKDELRSGRERKDAG